MEATSQMAAYVQLICLTIVSINTSLDPGGSSQAPAWQLALPLLSLRRTVRDVLEAAIMMIGRPDDQVPLPYREHAGDSPRQPKSNVAIKALNLAAVLACYISLQDQESNALYMKLLVANKMCCWITGKFNTTIRRHRRNIDQDPLPRHSKLAIDIATTFISHSTLLMLMTSESSPETLPVQTLRSTVWFLPLAAATITLSLIPDSHQGGTNAPPKIPPGFSRMQMCCWLSIAAFVGFGDLTQIIVRREPVVFGGLHPLHAGAVGAHYFAAMVMMLMGEAGDTTVDGSGSWVLDAGIAGLWLGLVGFNTLYVPRIDIPGRM